MCVVIVDATALLVTCMEEYKNTTSRSPFIRVLWNQYERVVNDLPRTNNATEGWQNAFNSMVSVAHPTAGRLARKLQQQQHSSAIKSQVKPKSKFLYSNKNTICT